MNCRLFVRSARLIFFDFSHEEHDECHIPTLCVTRVIAPVSLQSMFLWPSVIEAAADILEPLYDRLHSKSLPASAIPSKLAAGWNSAQPENQEAAKRSESGGARELTDEEFYEIPEHLRGLDRVVDPKAPDFMASGCVAGGTYHTLATLAQRQSPHRLLVKHNLI